MLVTGARCMTCDGKSLRVQRAAVDREAGFLDHFGQGRVGVARAGDVFAARAELDRAHELGDQVAGARAEDVRAQDAVRVLVREHLDAAVRVPQRARAAVREERERALLVGDVRGLQFLFRLAHRRDLGRGVHDVRNRVVVDVAVARDDVLDAGDAFFLGLVRQVNLQPHLLRLAKVRYPPALIFSMKSSKEPSQEVSAL